jgi:hypothetical protein
MLMTALDRDGNCRGSSALAKTQSGYAAIAKVSSQSLMAGSIPGVGLSPPN